MSEALLLVIITDALISLLVMDVTGAPVVVIIVKHSSYSRPVGGGNNLTSSLARRVT